MSISIIENQVIDFKNIANQEDCNCVGQNFIRKVNKNDVTEVQFISTIVNSNYNFTNSLDNWNVAYTDSFINPKPSVSYFAGVDTVGVCDGIINVSWPAGSYIVLNQYEFSIDNGLNWYNETTLPTLSFTALCADSYNCIIRDTVFSTQYTETLIIN